VSITRLRLIAACLEVAVVIVGFSPRVRASSLDYQTDSSPMVTTADSRRSSDDGSETSGISWGVMGPIGRRTVAAADKTVESTWAIPSDEPMSYLYSADPAHSKAGESAERGDAHGDFSPTAESSLARGNGNRFVYESFGKSDGAAPTGAKSDASSNFGNLPEDFSSNNFALAAPYEFDAADIAYIATVGSVDGTHSGSFQAKGASSGGVVTNDPIASAFTAVITNVPVAGVAGSIQTAPEPEGAGTGLIALMLFFIALQRRRMSNFEQTQRLRKPSIS